MSSNNSITGRYKGYNIIHKIRYWELKGENVQFLFEGTDIDYKKILGTDWLDFLSQVRFVWDNERKKVPNPRDQEEMGYDVYRNRSMGAIEEVAKLFSIKYIFKKFPKFAQGYSLVENFSAHNLKSNTITILHCPKKEFGEHFTFSNACFFKGFLKALPRTIESKSPSELQRSKDAKVNLEICVTDLHTVLNRDYNYLKKYIKLDIKDNKVFINGKEYGKKINLSVEKCKPEKPYNRPIKYLYVGKESDELISLDNELEKSGTGYLITDNFSVNNTLVLKKGEIFDAPYSKFNVSWEQVPFFARVGYFLSDISKAFKTPRKELMRKLEIADQRYFNEIRANQKEKEAKEKLKEYADKLEEMVRERTKQVELEKEKVLNAQKLLSRYMAPQLTERILNGDVEVIHNHKRLKLSLFFSDIQNFTGITDVLEPEDLADLLNDYFSHMFEIIDHYNGTLAQMTGDGLYVFFGAPGFTNDLDHAERCAKMAIDMQLKMKELRNRWFESGIDEPFHIRCGINTGTATVGSYGTEKRMEYVAMGMQVNIASRLESAAEPGTIYISHSTWGLIRNKIACEEVGKIEVKGLSRPIRAYKINIENIK